MVEKSRQIPRKYYTELMPDNYYLKDDNTTTRIKTIRLNPQEEANWNSKAIHEFLQGSHTDPTLQPLLDLGQAHTLTIRNLISFIRTHNGKVKLYILAMYFSNATLTEINHHLTILLKLNIIKKNSNGWISTTR